jgi:hypothetical protein
MIAGSDLSEQYAGKLKASYSTSSVRICRTKEMNISFNSLMLRKTREELDPQMTQMDADKVKPNSSILNFEQI